MFQNTSWITFIVSILHLAASLRTSNTSWSQEILLNLKTFVFPLAMADPEAIQLLQAIQTTYYFAAAGGALVAYDQVLTFSQEIDLVWNRNWSFMTILYLIARYSGSLSMVGLAAWYMCIDWTYSGIVNMYLAVSWAENIFLLAMQAILVIRVYALFNQSKKVLIFLATLYVLQATVVFVLTGLWLNDRVLHEYYTSMGPTIGSVMETINLNTYSLPVLLLALDSTILSLVFDTILLLFALWAFVKHALEARSLDRGWSINVLVTTLVADHLLYFICNLIWLSISLATNYVTTSSVYTSLLSDALFVINALIVVFGPRMVTSLRVMEKKTREEGGALEDEVSTIRFGTREPPTQSESVMEGGAVDENVQMD